MSIRASVVGEDRLRQKLNRYAKSVGGSSGEVAQAIASSALLVQGEARRLLNRGPSRSGEPRRLGGRSSAAGEPPKTDTGRLASSIDFSFDVSELSAAIGTNVKYGRFLEFGTQSMAARPWLFPTFERLKPRINDKIAEAVVREGRQHSR